MHFAFQSGVHDNQAIRQRLINTKGLTVLIWVPARKGIPGTEATDEYPGCHVRHSEKLNA